jgi:peroxiredoxin
MLRALLCCSLAILAACGKPPPPTAAVIALPADDGTTLAPLAADGRKATVLVFLMSDCPVGNASSPAIARLAAEFTARGVKFFGVYATETAAEIAAHRAEYGLPFPGLLDPQCRLARLAGATRAPEAAVFSPAGGLLYRGRIDDRATQPGSMKPVPSREDLRLALDAVLAGRAPEPPTTEAVGCHLPL